jgi:VacB/RNase II family 3'-5' exoribonuclease
VSGPAGSHRALLARVARRAMLDYGLEPDFPLATLAEAERLAPPAAVPDGEVRDLRGLPWCSIDNDDSRDLDQLTVAEESPGGGTCVRVAVADVSGAVAPGSALDGHAAANTTSVYTPAQVFPMLPERLSTDLTSLNPGQDRLAFVVEMTVDDGGAAAGTAVYRAVVHNHAQLAYPAVGAWLAGGGPLPAAAAAVPGLAGGLRLQDAAAHRLQAHRYERGALALDTLEARTRFDGDRVAGLVPAERDRARELIEDFMIAANGVTARFLAERGFPVLRRVVRSPARWPRLVDIARELGDDLPGAPDSRALSEFLARRRAADPLRFPDLSLTVIKLLGSGEYDATFPGEEVTGHFGLAVGEYAHSTAPNRRYPDLVTQRLLRAALAGAPVPYGRAALEELAVVCTRREDDAQKVERLVRKSAAACLLADRVGEDFDGVVTGAAAKGTWVRVLDPPVEGRIEQGREGLDVGDRVRVRLVGTDCERGFIDFARSRRSRRAGTRGPRRR